MLPKFELAPILMYLMMLPKVRRPSITPSSRISRLFSSRMMSADSLAMSTRIHRDADVGLAQGGRVIDAVTEKAHCMSPALQRLDDARLLRRGEFGEYRGSSDQLFKL